MEKDFESRRKIIQAGLVLPLIANIPIVEGTPFFQSGSFITPVKISEGLFKIYGNLAYDIKATSDIKISAPAIAENGQTVPIGIQGEKGLVSSVAIFAEHNTNPLVGVINFKAGSDLALGLRTKLYRTNDIYLIAKTNQGLIGVKKQVKVTVGCGGG